METIHSLRFAPPTCMYRSFPVEPPLDIKLQLDPQCDHSRHPTLLGMRCCCPTRRKDSRPSKRTPLVMQGRSSRKCGRVSQVPSPRTPCSRTPPSSPLPSLGGMQSIHSTTPVLPVCHVGLSFPLFVPPLYLLLGFVLAELSLSLQLNQTHQWMGSSLCRNRGWTSTVECRQNIWPATNPLSAVLNSSYSPSGSVRGGFLKPGPLRLRRVPQPRLTIHSHSGLCLCSMGSRRRWSQFRDSSPMNSLHSLDELDYNTETEGVGGPSDFTISLYRVVLGR